jgi:hypothetical protein
VWVRGAFFPDLIEAQAGERLRLVFRREETAACSEQVVIPSLGKSVMLPPFEDVAVELDPLPPGEREFTCGLGVLRGRILARDDAVSRSVVSTEPKTGLVPGGGARGATHVSDGFPLRRDWLLLYLGVACCVAIALVLILVAVGVL